MSQYNFTLRSTGLLSKYGFGDGDQFSDFIIDNNYHVNWTTQEFAMDKEVLKRVVEQYLLPALPVSVRLQCFVTHHNNVRVHPEDYEELATQPEVTIELTEQQLRDICEEVKQEYLKES
jgi:hypothetical protein